VGKGVAAAVTDPWATAKGVGRGLKRFGTNLGRQAKRAGDQAAASAKDGGQKGGGPEKSTTDQVAAAGIGVAHSMLGVNAGTRRWA
jgi:hypothetical protein